MCMGLLFINVCMCTLCMPGAHGGQESQSLELEVQMTGNIRWVLCKGAQCSESPGHLPWWSSVCLLACLFKIKSQILTIIQIIQVFLTWVRRCTFCFQILADPRDEHKPLSVPSSLKLTMNSLLIWKLHQGAGTPHPGMRSLEERTQGTQGVRAPSTGAGQAGEVHIC